MRRAGHGNVRVMGVNVNCYVLDYHCGTDWTTLGLAIAVYGALEPTQSYTVTYTAGLYYCCCCCCASVQHHSAAARTQRLSSSAS